MRAPPKHGRCSSINWRAVVLDPESRDSEGMTGLHIAASEGDDERCRDLLLRGADPNARNGEHVREDGLYRDWYWDPGYTPLMFAARRAHVGIVRLLLDSGADAKLADQFDGTALHAAVAGGNAEIVGLILGAGAAPNHFCYLRHFEEGLGWYFIGTALHVAALSNHPDIAALLIEAGADHSAASFDMKTPLIYAAARGFTDVIDVLCTLGANPNSREHSYGYSAFLDRTPLHYAASNGHLDAWNALVRHGAEPLARESHSGKTALEIAQERGMIDVQG